MLERLLGRVQHLREGEYHLKTYPHSNNIELWYDVHGGWMPVYYRSADEYVDRTGMPTNIVKTIVQNQLQLVEVGAGIAELAPSIARAGGKRPIVIDPLNYQAIFSLLQKACKKNISNENKRIARTLMERVSLYLDPRAIELMPLTLQQAYLQFGQKLSGIADVVVDVAGAIYYNAEMRSVYNFECNWLLKQDPPGVIYTDQNWLK